MRFFSKHPSYQILWRPENRQYAADGTKIVLEGIQYIQFNNCMFETNDVDVCVHLLKSSAYGKDIFSDIQLSQMHDGTWVEELKKHLEVPAVAPDFEIEKIKRELAQRVVPKIKTTESKQEQATFEKVTSPTAPPQAAPAKV